MIQRKLGKNPAGKRLELIQKSPNYRNGQFRNLNHTPQFAKDYNFGKIIYEKLFKKFPDLKPIDLIPSVKTDVKKIDLKKNILIWFGHSSYYLQIDGIRILVDPVFSKNASPIPNTLNAFKGANRYSAKDFPAIDYLFITHDHYDHLDYPTILALKDKVRNVICGLGVGSHLEHWGYDSKIIHERDWYDIVDIKQDFRVSIEPARHFSGRSLSRNNTLWVSFVLQTPSLQIYLGGDSGYDIHYANIGDKYGFFDLAILENGQYNKAWPYIHEKPEEVLMAAQDLNAKRILPVHSSKFILSNHPWYEPLTLLSEFNKSYQFPVLTPMIGEIVDLDNPNQKFEEWWVGLK